MKKNKKNSLRPWMLVTMGIIYSSKAFAKNFNPQAVYGPVQPSKENVIGIISLILIPIVLVVGLIFHFYKKKKKKNAKKNSKNRRT